MAPIVNIAIVATGGALGCCLRYGVCCIANISQVRGLGTLLVNAIGCFIIGVLYAVFSRYEITECWRLFLFIGLLGGFTTFSSYTMDAINMAQSGVPMQALMYVAVTNILGFILAGLGFYLTYKLVKV